MANTSWMRSFTQRWGKYVIVPLVIAMLTGCEGKGVVHDGLSLSI